MGGGEGEHNLHRKLASGTLEITIKTQIHCKNRELYYLQGELIFHCACIKVIEICL
jgi:hypothetical protein